jgi:hypothetical protein
MRRKDNLYLVGMDVGGEGEARSFVSHIEGNPGLDNKALRDPTNLDVLLARESGRYEIGIDAVAGNFAVRMDKSLHSGLPPVIAAQTALLGQHGIAGEAAFQTAIRHDSYESLFEMTKKNPDAMRAARADPLNREGPVSWKPGSAHRPTPAVISGLSRKP